MCLIEIWLAVLEFSHFLSFNFLKHKDLNDLNELRVRKQHHILKLKQYSIFSNLTSVGTNYGG